MGKKFVIEFEEKPFYKMQRRGTSETEKLWRVKGFNSLVFDENGIKKLTPLEDTLDLDKLEVHMNGFDEGYDAGLRILWGRIRKVFGNPNDGAYRSSQLSQIFGYDWIYDSLSLSPSEFLKKISDYEEMMSEIKAGDELVLTSADTVCICTCDVGTCNDEVYVMFDDGSCGQYPEDKLRKTGKHYSSFDEFLKRKEGYSL